MKLLVSALEHSANVHLGSLKKELSEDVTFIGIFNKDFGVPIIDLRSLAIMGFIDALKKLRFFFALNAQMLELAKEADKVLLIDSSGFNLPLAKKIKKRYPNKEIIYYILPQAWAWKKKRIPVLERTVDHLASILPFEKNYYSQNSSITYVGHPLLDIIKEYKTELNASIKNVVFMPGSRKSEIKALMPIFAILIQKLQINATIIVPTHFTKEEIQELYGNLSSYRISHEAHKELYATDFAFICSGTATLEAALIGTPFILSYIAKPLDYFIASKLVKLTHIGVANIMFEEMYGRELHPEFIQNEVSIENLYKSYKNYDREKFLYDSKSLRSYLQHGSSKTVASIIEEKICK